MLHYSKYNMFEITQRFCTLDRLTTNIDARSLFNQCWNISPNDTVAAAIVLRDRNVGRGERKLFRWFLRWMVYKGRECEAHLARLLPLIPDFGRWDDILWGGEMGYTLMSQTLQDEKMMLDANPHFRPSLCCKWAPTESCSPQNARVLANKMGCTMRTYRKRFLTPLRKRLLIVERLMTNGDLGTVSRLGDGLSIHTIASNETFFWRNAVTFSTIELRRDELTTFRETRLRTMTPIDMISICQGHPFTNMFHMEPTRSTVI